ncbi:SPOR domain-containing protein [candidate division CSSED10-310 bacterium]|uniref:SPOR domain-containing protein n=1 Tax=candidate division CSSED10-310 bacterium TaxID=2855610 RepID=A0ABV6YXK1_UNCC1
MTQRKKDYSFSTRTFSLFLSVCAVIAFLCFILGFQIGRVRGIQTAQFPNAEVAGSEEDSPSSVETPIPFKSETLSFYKSVHRTTPIISYEKKTPPPTSKDQKVKRSPTPPASAEKVTTGGKFTIQVASLSDQAKAENLKNSLNSHGFPAYISSFTQANKQVMYRVRVGHFSDKSTANKVAERIKEKEKLKPWVTPL